MNYIILIFSWGLYLAVHSIFASNQVKEVFYHTFSMSKKLYRLLYAFTSTVGIILLILLMAVVQSKSFFIPEAGLKLAALIIATWGVLIISMAFRHLSGLSFLGLRREESTQLVKTGIHAKVRHPIYSGTILILIGMLIYSPTDVALVSVLTIFAYLPVGIWLEERKLIVEFGDEYLEYRKHVAALIPRL